MATSVTSDHPLQLAPASPMELGDVKPETGVPRAESERIVLRLCDAATRLRRTERFKIRVAERSAQVDVLHSAQQRCYADLQAQAGDYGGPEYSAALQAYETASTTYEKAKKRLKEFLQKMESDVNIQAHVVKDEQL